MSLHATTCHARAEVTDRLFLEEPLAEALRDSAPLLTVHAPAPVMPPEWLLRALPESDGFAWCPPEGVAFAAAGVARSVRPSDEPLSARVAGLFEGLHEVTLDGGAAVPLRALAALPFEPDDTETGSVFVPRWRLALDRSGAWLSFTTRAAERASASGRAALVAEWERVRSALDEVALARRSVESSAAAVVQLDHGDVDGWMAAVVRTREAIRDARFGKVVLARSATVKLDRAVDACDVLERLSLSGWGTRYALRRKGTTFVGLSPERLVSRSGPEVNSDALAGTADVGAEGALRTSAKDLAEHRHVVQEIVRTLEPLCRHVESAEAPSIRVLRHLTHLHTPVRGTLERPHHVLALVEALHPTPATGGVPGEGALEFLREVEGQPRGLYAGPIGWFDANGDGDFWVALRCGFIEGAKAIVWAGAGIVHDSEATSELRETQLKQRAFLAALGTKP